jgi:uncharacterized membrane protein
MAGFPLHSRWIVGAAVLYLLAGCCWIPVLVLQYRMRRLALTASIDNRPLPPEYKRAARLWLWLGVPAFLAMLGIYGLMIFKPS